MLTPKLTVPVFLIVICNGKIVGHNGPEETTQTEHGVEQQIEMVTVNVRCAGGMGVSRLGI